MVLLKPQLQTLDLIPLIRWDLNPKLCVLNSRQLLTFLLSLSAFQLWFSAKFSRVSLYTGAVKFGKVHTDWGPHFLWFHPFLHLSILTHQFLAVLIFDLRILLLAWTLSPGHRADWGVLSYEKPVNCGTHLVCLSFGKYNISSSFCLFSVDMKRHKNRHRYICPKFTIVTGRRLSPIYTAVLSESWQLNCWILISERNSGANIKIRIYQQKHNLVKCF